MIERTLVVIKPDGVRRNLIGEIIRRYESNGLKIIAMKMIQVDKELVSKHYPNDEQYLISLGKKSERAGAKIDSPIDQGGKILQWLRDYITQGPVVAIIFEGENAISRIREITGYTNPAEAAKGTIRGDLGDDNILDANEGKRPVRNLIHASGNPEEAKKEIGLWFRPEEILKK